MIILKLLCILDAIIAWCYLILNSKHTILGVGGFNDEMQQQ